MLVKDLLEVINGAEFVAIMKAGRVLDSCQACRVYERLKACEVERVSVSHSKSSATVIYLKD